MKHAAVSRFAKQKFQDALSSTAHMVEEDTKNSLPTGAEGWEKAKAAII